MKDDFILKIDGNQFLNNLLYLERLKNKKILPVIKANAYGHDSKLIASLLQKNGYKEVAVARLSEAKEILNTLSSRDFQILVFETLDTETLLEIKDNPFIEISANSYSQLLELIKIDFPLNRVHLKIDFNFSRYGVTEIFHEDLITLIHEKNLFFKGIYSHFFASSHEDSLMIIDNFKKLLFSIGTNHFSQIHLQNSFTTITLNIDFVTHIRPGMLIYGLFDDGIFDKNIKRISSLVGKVFSVSDITHSKYIAYKEKKGSIISSFPYIAKLKMGYGDGFFKKNEESFCLINGKEYPIFLVSMDTTFVGVDSSVTIGDTVTLYHDIYKSAKHLNMEPQELILNINNRIKREMPNS